MQSKHKTLFLQVKILWQILTTISKLLLFPNISVCFSYHIRSNGFIAYNTKWVLLIVEESNYTADDIHIFGLCWIVISHCQSDHNFLSLYQENI